MDTIIIASLGMAFCTFAIAFMLFSKTWQSGIVAIVNGVLVALSIVYNMVILAVISFLILSALILVRIIKRN